MATKKQKNTALGVLAVAGAAAGAYFLFGRDAKASTPAKGPDLPPGNDDPPSDPPRPTPSAIKKAPGNPPPGNCLSTAMGGNNDYDKAYWDAGTPQQSRQRVVSNLHELGYAFQGETNSNGVFKPSAIVKRFQEDYNLVSRAEGADAGMGGLHMDGVAGPCTLNAIKFLMDEGGASLGFAGAARDERERLGLPVNF